MYGEKKPTMWPMTNTKIVLIVLVVIGLLAQFGTARSENETDPLGFTREAPVDSVGVLLDINNDLRLEIDLITNELDHTKALLGISKRPWYEIVWDSEVVKFAIFVLGVWLGAYAGG